MEQNYFWHGGIHFTNKTPIGKTLHKLPIRTIADGVVVAYRTHQSYLSNQLSSIAAYTKQINSNQTEEIIKDPHYRYSSCFCLIKHDYQFPISTIGTLHPTKAKTATDWVGRTVELQSSVRVTDHADFIATLGKGSLLYIRCVTDIQVAAELVEIKERRGATATELKSGEQSKTLNDIIYFEGFDQNGEVLKVGEKSILRNMPIRDWSQTREITLTTNYHAYSGSDPQSTRYQIPLKKGTTYSVVEVEGALDVIENRYYLSVKLLEDSEGELTAHSKAQLPRTALPDNKLFKVGDIVWIAFADKLGIPEQVTEDNKLVDVIKNNSHNKFTFYTLYMHRLPVEGYGTTTNKNRCRAPLVINRVEVATT